MKVSKTTYSIIVYKMGFFLVCFFINILTAQELKSTESKQNFIYENHSLDKIECDECEEAIDLFHKAFVQQNSFKSDVFESMKSLIDRCIIQNKDKLSKKTQKQIDLLSGIIDGGPTSYGNDSFWRINCCSSNLKDDRSRFYIDYKETILNFKNAMNEQLSPSCKECREIVDDFYNSFLNYKSQKLTEQQFQELKEKTIRCKFQKKSDCGNDMEKKLAVLSGRLGGGPTVYGEDSKWRLQDRISKKTNLGDIKLIDQLSKQDIIFQLNGKYGVMDEKGFVFIKPDYEFIKKIEVSNVPFFIVKSLNKYGIIGFDAKELIKPSFNKILYYTNTKDRFLLYSDGEKWGTINLLPTIRVNSPIYDNASLLGEWTWVAKNKKIGFLNSEGELIDGYKWDGFLSSVLPSRNLLGVKLGDKFGLVGINSKEIVPAIYDEIGYSNESVKDKTLISGIIPIKVNNKCGYIDESGKILIEPKYDDILGFGIKGVGQDRVCFVKNDNKWGMLSKKTFKELTQIQYDEMLDFKNGFSQVKISEKIGLVNIEGREIIKPQFDKIIGIETNNGFFIVQKMGLYGLVRNDGTIISPTKYQNIENNLGCWTVKLENKIGIIDNNGVLIVQPKYQEIGIFKNGFASIKFNRKYGMLSEQGYETVKPMYDYPFEFINDYATVSINGKSFRIDTKGEKVINNFTNSSLSSLTIEDRSVSDILTKKFDDMYTTAVSNLIYSGALGKKYNFDLDVKNSINTIKSEVEGWIGGQMTASQLNEFNQIKNASESRTTSAMRAMSEVINIDNENKQNKSKGSVHKCTWCGRKILGSGFSLEGRKIVSGGPYAEVVHSSNESCDNHYDTQDCALKARYARDGY